MRGTKITGNWDGELIFREKTLDESLLDDEHTDCEFCGGLGEYEEEYLYRDESGNVHIEGTGRFKKCFNCNEEDDGNE